MQDNVSIDSSTLQNGASDVSHSHTTGLELVIASANTMSSRQPTNATASKAKLDAPSFQIAERSARFATYFQHLIANIDKLLRQHHPPNSQRVRLLVVIFLIPLV